MKIRIKYGNGNTKRDGSGFSFGSSFGFGASWGVGSSFNSGDPFRTSYGEGSYDGSGEG